MRSAPLRLAVVAALGACQHAAPVEKGGGLLASVAAPEGPSDVELWSLIEQDTGELDFVGLDAVGAEEARIGMIGQADRTAHVWVTTAGDGASVTLTEDGTILDYSFPAHDATLDVLLSAQGALATDCPGCSGGWRWGPIEWGTVTACVGAVAALLLGRSGGRGANYYLGRLCSAGAVLAMMNDVYGFEGGEVDIELLEARVSTPSPLTSTLEQIFECPSEDVTSVAPVFARLEQTGTHRLTIESQVDNTERDGRGLRWIPIDDPDYSRVAGGPLITTRALPGRRLRLRMEVADGASVNPYETAGFDLRSIACITAY